MRTRCTELPVSSKESFEAAASEAVACGDSETTQNNEEFAAALTRREVLCLSSRISSADVTHPEQARQSLSVTRATTSVGGKCWRVRRRRFFTRSPVRLLPSAELADAFGTRRLLVPVALSACMGAPTEPGGRARTAPETGRTHLSSGLRKSLRSSVPNFTPAVKLALAALFCHCR